MSKLLIIIIIIIGCNRPCMFVCNFCTYGGRRHTVFDCCVTIVRDTQILIQKKLDRHRHKTLHTLANTRRIFRSKLSGRSKGGVCVPTPPPIFRVRLFTVYRTNKYSTVVLATRERLYFSIYYTQYYNSIAIFPSPKSR